jgi:ribosomal protein S4
MIRYIHGYSDASRKASRYLNFDPSNRKTIGFSIPRPSQKLAKWTHKHSVINKRINRTIYRDRLIKSPEMRLDVSLWRSTMFVNRFESYNFVVSKGVLVNNKITHHPALYLKAGDLVALPFLNNIETNTIPLNIPLAKVQFILLSPTATILPPKDPLPFHREVDLSTYSFVFKHAPTLLPEHPTTASISHA